MKFLCPAFMALSLLCSQAFAITVGAEQPEHYLPWLQNKNVALVVNQTSRVKHTHLVDFLLNKNIQVSRVMSPEHGFRGVASAGEKIADGIDPETGLPILSLYGKTRKPTPAMLNGVDVIVFDIQDVGTRFYTYISTLHLVMEAAAEQHITMVVLDRPNPNGAFVDGPVREEAFQSFVGMDPIPLLHGMTVGELAKMIKGEGWVEHADMLSLYVVAVENYQSDMPYSLPVAPSPNLPNDDAVRLYPSLCLFEGTSVSVGRGTDFPFQVIGHDSVRLGEFMFTPHSMPSAPHPKLQNTLLFGLDLRNSKTHGFDLSLLIETASAFNKAQQPFFTRPEFFDKLSGTDSLRKSLLSGLTEKQIRAQWQPGLAAFKQQRNRYLLYSGKSL